MECNDCETELDTIVPKAKLMFRSVYECPDCGGRRLQLSGGSIDRLSYRIRYCWVERTV